MHREMTLKQRIGLCLAAFFMALAAQIFLSFYQSGTVLRELDDQMGNFNAISRFQNGVQQSLNALESYRWEYGDAGELLDQLHSSSSVMSAWLWRIEGDLGTVSEEQYLLYSAVCTTYDSYKELLDQLEEEVSMGRDAAAAQLYYDKVSPCGGYLRQYTQQLLNKAITDGQGDYTTVSALSDRVKWAQTIVVALCLALGSLMAREVMHLLTPVQQMIGASRDISQGSYDTPDVPVPRQDEMGQLADAFNRMKHSMAEQVNTLREKNEIERELHRQKTEALEMQNRMERSRLQQLRSQIDPHFLFNTLNVILQTAGTEKAYRTQALITALAHLLRYSLMSNDEQVPLSREVRIVDEYYSIYHVRFGDRIRMEWRISDSLDLTETMVPSFILQPIVENAFKHGISPKEEGGVVRIRVNPLREKGLLYISVCDNGVGIEMPGMSGLDAARAVLAQRPACRVIFVTAYSLFQYAHEAVHLGACDYLLKPVDPDELEASIRRAMRQIEAERKLEELARTTELSPEPETSEIPENPEEGAPEAESPEGENSQTAMVMTQVRRYLEDNYMFDLSLDSVGEILHISPAYLSAQFKKYQKMNFLDCLTELRINAAKELLADPFRSSAEVASMVGYEDASYFARAFKKRTGMTPTQYRRQAGKKSAEAHL